MGVERERARTALWTGGVSRVTGGRAGAEKEGAERGQTRRRVSLPPRSRRGGGGEGKKDSSCTLSLYGAWRGRADEALDLWREGAGRGAGRDGSERGAPPSSRKGEECGRGGGGLRTRACPARRLRSSPRPARTGPTEGAMRTEGAGPALSPGAIFGLGPPLTPRLVGADCRPPLRGKLTVALRFAVN